MDKNSKEKIIQAVFGFLEVADGRTDNSAKADLIREMIEELIIKDAVSGESNIGNPASPWARLDHELRSPMNGILGFTEILLEDLQDPDLRWKAEQIQISAVKLMKLLDNSSIYRYSISSEQGPMENSRESATPAKPTELNQSTVRKKAKSAGKKLPNILIVEDNQINSNLLMHHLKKYCHLFFSQTGKAAIEVAKREKIDAIFMDINLGAGMDGTEAMLEIRKQVGNEKLPVIAVTGFAGKEDRDKFLNAGFDEFIAKPFERQEIISVIGNLIKKGE